MAKCEITFSSGVRGYSGLDKMPWVQILVWAISKLSTYSWTIMKICHACTIAHTLLVSCS